MVIQYGSKRYRWFYKKDNIQFDPNHIIAPIEKQKQNKPWYNVTYYMFSCGTDNKYQTDPTEKVREGKTAPHAIYSVTLYIKGPFCD